MEFAVICCVALAVSAVTFLSGFGLGTLLMPAFALFFPIPVAVAGTAVVHLANNLFKTALMAKHADMGVAARFALPAALTAMAGAYLLNEIAGVEPLVRYSIGQHSFEVTVVKLVAASLIGMFAFLEMWPRFENVAFQRKYLSLGGALSGFFGGLSGLQGALRSAFLIRAGLTKEQFIATGVVSAVVVDASRLLVYGRTFFLRDLSTVGEHGTGNLILAGMVAAWIGSYFGSKLLQKVTYRGVQILVGTMLLAVSAALAVGII